MSKNEPKSIESRRRRSYPFHHYPFESLDELYNLGKIPPIPKNIFPNKRRTISCLLCVLTSSILGFALANKGAEAIADLFDNKCTDDKSVNNKCPKE